MSQLTIRGIIGKGLQLASGAREDHLEIPSNVYKDRTILTDASVGRQMPFFKEAGVPDIDTMYAGTINLQIAPKEISILKPDYTITCEWIPGVKETFWLVSAMIGFEGEEYRGYVYYPCISEIHPPNDSVIELLTEKIPGVEYGKEITVSVSDTALTFK